MTPFLEQVARHYYAEGGIEDLCFVFPNRRALVFFRKYLGGCVAGDKRVMRVHELVTVDDFFQRLSGLKKTAGSRIATMRMIQVAMRLPPCGAFCTESSPVLEG